MQTPHNTRQVAKRQVAKRRSSSDPSIKQAICIVIIVIIIITNPLQDAERRYLDPEPSVEMLCAIVNNNVRCYNESMEFAERVEDTLDDDHKV